MLANMLAWHGHGLGFESREGRIGDGLSKSLA